MKRALISIGVACLVATLVYLALPNEMNAEKAGHVIVFCLHRRGSRHIAAVETRTGVTSQSTQVTARLSTHPYDLFFDIFEKHLTSD